jgi:NDP-sugar pyrophosphorylase family protein
MTVQPFNKYIAQGVTKQLSVKISDNCVVGESTTLGCPSNEIQTHYRNTDEIAKGNLKTSIKESVIGRNCTIGDCTKIKNCIIWENVTIGNNCHLEDALICNDVCVNDGVTIKPGVMLDRGVVVQANATIENNTIASNLCFGMEDNRVVYT